LSNYTSFFNELLKRPFDLSDVISSTLVGSNLNSKFNNQSDIDLIVIVKNLNKNNFTKIRKIIKSINLNMYKLEKYNIVINSTFGPLKFEKKDQIIIHLMIYDIKGHINHVLESPFTCFDWERSKKYLGVSLKKIFSVGNLTLNDFFNNRRGIKSYISDLKEGVITYRKYIFERKNYYLIKKRKK
jgi:ribonuclease H / adenosylcobalamin/alpha-ribazole phosphatase